MDFIMKNNKLKVLILIAFCLLLFLPSAINRDLHYRDELRYVEVAREMTVNHQWLVPHFGGEIYSDKPPVFFWILNFFKNIFNDYSTLAMVLPSIISSIIIVFLTYYFGSLLFGKKYSLLSGVILATSFLYFGLSIFVRMDMMMLVFITATFISFYIGYIKEKPYKGRYYLLMFILMGIATAIKGPAGFLDPLVAIPVFLLLDGNLAELKNMKLVKGFALFFAVILAWIIPAVIIGGKDYAYQLLIVQTIGRSVDSFAHQKPFYYYFLTFPVTFFPWSIFLISSFVYIFKNRKKIDQKAKYLLSWFWVPFLLFSLVSGKLDIYLLPVYPAASLLVVYLFKKIYENKLKDENISKQKNKSYIYIPSFIVFLLFIIIALIIPEKAEGININSLLLPAIVILILGGIGGLISLYKKKLSIIPYLIVFIFFFFLFNFSISVVPALSRGYTKKPIANKIVQLKEEDNISNIVAYKYGEPESLGVYTKFLIHDVGNKDQLVKYLNDNNNVLVLVDKEDWNKLKINQAMNLKKEYSSNGYLLIYKD